MIPAPEYLDFFAREYLDDFVAKGGAAVKFVVAGDDQTQGAFSAQLGTRARDAGYIHCTVDAARTRVHMIDQVFFSVARQVDFDATAAAFLRVALDELRMPVDDGDVLTLARIAERHAYDPGELQRDINRVLQRKVLGDHGMTREFRVAIVRLCQGHLRGALGEESEAQAIGEWLRGELRHIVRLRSALIFTRIGRHNARAMLLSLSRWLRRTGAAGLSLEFDLRRLAIARRLVPVPEDAPVFYSKAAVLDAYEVLRQLIDATDELAWCSIVVTAPPEFLTDDKRGLDAYSALKLRLWNEVHDRQRDNPFSSLVRLEAS